MARADVQISIGVKFSPELESIIREINTLSNGAMEIMNSDGEISREQVTELLAGVSQACLDFMIELGNGSVDIKQESNSDKLIKAMKKM